MIHLKSALIGGIVSTAVAYAPVDIKVDEKAKQLHRIDSLNILAYTFLLILMVSRRRYRSRFGFGAAD